MGSTATLNVLRNIGRFGVLLALVALVVFGWMRYENFLGSFNVLSVLRYNSMFALVALGMCFVIITGGIDLSVGSTAALGSVVAELTEYQPGSVVARRDTTPGPATASSSGL